MPIRAEEVKDRMIEYGTITVRMLAQLAEQVGPADPASHPQQPAHQAQHERLRQELHLDITRRGTHRLAQADLARALGHARPA